jgi:tetratricopeptide (TPR) repeat protein
LKNLPEVDFIYIASPKDILNKDIHTIAKYSRIGIGLISITDNEIGWPLKPQEIEPARLSLVSASSVSNVVPGETFDLKLSFGNSGGKIARKIEVECMTLGPFKLISEQIQRISMLPPGDRANVNFRFRVYDEVTPGQYFIFTKWTDQSKQGSEIFDLEVKSRSSEYIERLVTNAIADLNNVMSKNVEDLAREIDNAVEKGYLNIKDHIYDKSIWNTLGMAYFNQGLLKQAEYVYRNMLETLEKYEVAHNEKIHKGLAFHNLGVILYNQGKMKEAKEMFLKAYEEDVRTFGQENASKGQAKRALDELKFDTTI